MIGRDYKAQVDLLLRVLPLISKESDFALKGGTAINLFLRNMPRLSVDIDLTFLPILGREETFTKISSAISRLKKSIESSLSGTVLSLSQRLTIKMISTCFRYFQDVGSTLLSEIRGIGRIAGAAVLFRPSVSSQSQNTMG